MRKSLWVLLVAVMAIFAISPALAQDETIADIVVGSATGDTPQFTTLLAAVQAADPAVLEALSDPSQQLTVFAPTDEAFAQLSEFLGAEQFDSILADPATLSNILTFHVVPGVYTADDVQTALDVNGGQTVTLPTLNGQYIDISGATSGNILINGAPLNMEMVDIQASNGVIHVIDAVITPDDRTIADIVVESAGEETPEFATLLAAVQAADPAVLETLSNPDATLTVFAPTDAAFNALGDETLATVLADPAVLTNVLLYHVVPDTAYYSGDLNAELLSDMPEMNDAAEATPEATDEAAPEATDDMTMGVWGARSLELTTAQGAPVTITLGEDRSVTINGANFVIVDIDAVNGVIHVIDAVLLPPETE